MEIRQLLARNVQHLRKARGFSQEELAHRAEIDRSYVSSLERGLYAATVDMIAKIARALEVSPQALLELDKGKLPIGTDIEGAS